MCSFQLEGAKTVRVTATLGGTLDETEAEGAVSAYVETTAIRLLMLIGCRKDESVTLH